MRKFILGKSGKTIVNAEHVQAIYIYEDEGMDEHGDLVSTGVFKIIAMIRDQEDRIFLATFDTDDADENFTAAQKYLAELVVELNGGTQ